jgi:hypothetical protein
MRRTPGWRLLTYVVAIGLSEGLLLMAHDFTEANPPSAAAPPHRAAKEQPAPVAPVNAKPVKPADFTKSVIELPATRILAAQTTPAAPAPAADIVNPKVQPGKVHWHADREAACRAARKSGKPVLLFQMMGKLDDRFC